MTGNGALLLLSVLSDTRHSFWFSSHYNGQKERISGVPGKRDEIMGFSWQMVLKPFPGALR